MLRNQVEKIQNPLEKEIAWKQVLELFPEFNSYIHLTHHIHLDVVNDFLREPALNICEEMADAFDAGKRIFVFECIREAIDLDHILKVHRIAELTKNRIEGSTLLYITGMNDGNDAYQRIRERYNLPEILSILSCNYAEYITQKATTLYKYTGPYKPYYKKKNFLCYNRTPREHRIKLLDFMLGSNIINQSYYSFEGNVAGDDWISRIDTLTNYPAIRNNKHLFPIRLNLSDTRQFPTTVELDDIQYFDNSHMSIVTETSFYERTDTRYNYTGGAEDGIHLTENTYKCFPLKHPFILVGQPGSLAFLKKQGYRTFHPFIDETYDTITNGVERMKAIQKEINRLSLLNGKEWVLLTEQMVDIVEHNRTHFFSQRNFKNETDAFTKIQLSLINNESKELAFIANSNKPIKPLDCGIPPTVILKHEHGEIISIPLMWITKQMAVIREHTLSNDTVMKYPVYLEGDTTFIRDEIVTIIRNANPNGTDYNRGLAWCAGTGISGFEFLINGLSKHMTFTDILDTAMDSVNLNAHQLGLINQVKTYVTPMIHRLPQMDKFDFVFGSPPTSNNFFNHIRYIANEVSGTGIEELTNSARKCVDHNWAIHREFFRNIGERLVDGADVFMLELSSDDTLRHLGTINGLKYVNTYSLKSIEHCCIMHYKKIK